MGSVIAADVTVIVPIALRTTDTDTADGILAMVITMVANWAVIRATEAGIKEEN